MISHPDCNCSSCVKLSGGKSEAPTATAVELVDCEIYHGLDPQKYPEDLFDLPYKEAKLAFTLIYVAGKLGGFQSLKAVAREMGVSVGQVRELRKKLRLHDRLLKSRKLARGS